MLWIFLRGLTRETAHWGSFPTDFEQALPGSKVICLDLPGNGELHHMTSPMSISMMVTYCRDELFKRGHPPPYFLLAMSLGAMVATEWSYRGSGEVSGSVLINSSLGKFSPFYRRMRPRNYLPLLRLVLLTPNPADAERIILQLTSNRAAQRAQVIDHWIQARIKHPVSRTNALRQVVAALRYRVRSGAPDTDVLILSSKQDALVHANCSLAISSSWKCPVQLHPMAGHDLVLDDPNWVIEKVQQWLGRQ
jgi:alpha-beta hydrolase superfamily lysophospholipase